MPELPEVETVVRGLRPLVEGRTLTRVQLNRPDLRFPFPGNFVSSLQGISVLRLTRRAKYMLWELDGNLGLLSHLGMSGNFRSVPQSDLYAPQKHDHVVFLLDDGRRIIYSDPRRFGFMTIFDGLNPESCPYLEKLGPEPLGNAFSGAHLQSVCKGRKAPIKSVLLDQHTVAGLGNIYVCEALYRARIHPAKPAGRIAARKLDELAQHVRDVLHEAIRSGGSTLRDFAGTDGQGGYFQHHFDVYGREGEPCLTPGCRGTITRSVQSGRSSFFCPKCQKMARK